MLLAAEPSKNGIRIRYMLTKNEGITYEVPKNSVSMSTPFAPNLNRLIKITRKSRTTLALSKLQSSQAPENRKVGMRTGKVRQPVKGNRAARHSKAAKKKARPKGRAGMAKEHKKKLT